MNCSFVVSLTLESSQFERDEPEKMSPFYLTPFYFKDTRAKKMPLEVSNHSKLPVDFVLWAYRLFLDREPNNFEDVIAKTQVGDTKDLRKVFLESEEFRIKNTGNERVMQQLADTPMDIEEFKSQDYLNEFLKHVQDVWNALGESEPHWSVLSADRYKQELLSDNIESFNDSGRIEVGKVTKDLVRNNIDIVSLSDCLEYGCGVGRVTRWLAEHFDSVNAFDISTSHLQLAAQYMGESGVKNVSFERVMDLSELDRLPRVDFVYSVIVLQHNPPPVIEYILRNLLQALRKNGIAYFQVPTYRFGYKFSIKEYLDGVTMSDGKKHIEMHVLPQEKIFRLIHEGNARLIEVFEDDWAGTGYRSNTFIVKKQA